MLDFLCEGRFTGEEVRRMGFTCTQEGGFPHIAFCFYEDSGRKNKTQSFSIDRFARDRHFEYYDHEGDLAGHDRLTVLMDIINKEYDGDIQAYLCQFALCEVDRRKAQIRDERYIRPLNACIQKASERWVWFD